MKFLRLSDMIISFISADFSTSWKDILPENIVRWEISSYAARNVPFEMLLRSPYLKSSAYSFEVWMEKYIKYAGWLHVPEEAGRIHLLLSRFLDSANIDKIGSEIFLLAKINNDIDDLSIAHFESHSAYDVYRRLSPSDIDYSGSPEPVNPIFRATCSDWQSRSEWEGVPMYRATPYNKFTAIVPDSLKAY